MTVTEIRKLAAQLNRLADSAEKLGANPEDVAVLVQLDSATVEHLSQNSDMPLLVTGAQADDKNFFLYLDVQAQ
jgi:hypothetical protein